MIPPRIKKLPNLHKPQPGAIVKNKNTDKHNNPSLYQGGARLL